MKLYLALLSICLAPLGFAQAKKPIVGEVTQQKESLGAEGSLKKLLTIQGVDEQYAKCSKALSSNLEGLSDCIWNGHGSIPALSDALKKQVQQSYAQEQMDENRDQSRKPASASSIDLTKKSKQLSVDYMSDPAVVKLSESFQKKLEAVLIGTEQQQKDTKTVAIVDHSKFVDLYSTELGKTIVSAFTSYCMEVDFSQNYETVAQNCVDDQNKPMGCKVYVLGKSKNTIVKNNIDSLNNSDLKSDQGKWTGCIASVTHVCYTEFSQITPQISQSDLASSKERACLIMDYVKSARKNLLVLDEQKKFYKQMKEDSKNEVGLVIKNQRNIVLNEKNNMDTATTVTSKEIEDSFEPESKKLKKEMEKCIDDNNQIVDMAACKNYLSTNTEEKKKQLAEFSLRQYAQEATLDDKLKDKSEVEKYLKNEGYDEAKRNQILKDDQSIKAISDEISGRYKQEREAIIKSMAKKIGEQTATNDGSISQTDDQRKLQDIKNSFSSRPDDLKQLVHFNNIVSSYLEVGSGGTKSRNVASLFQELNNGAKKFGNADGAQLSKDLAKSAQNSGLKQEHKSGDSSTTLDVKDLNQIIKYTNEK